MRRLSIALLALVPVIAAQDKPNGYLGVHVAGVQDDGHDHKIPAGVKQGVVVTHVEKGSAAEKAGLRPGDVMVFFDGKDVGDVEALIAAVQKHKAGDKVTYKVLRGTGSIEGTLTLGKRPVDMPAERERDVRAEKKPGGDLDKRLDAVAEQLEALRGRLAGEKPRERAAPAPRNVMGWMERVNRRMDRIEKKLDRILDLLQKRK